MPSRFSPYFRNCFILLSILIVVTGCKESTPLSMPKPAVTVITLKSQPVTLTRELSGRLTSSLIAEVRPQVSGIVRGRLFTEGSLVEAGQVLYQLDDATYRADVVSAQASLDSAKAKLHAEQLRAKRSDELIKTNTISAQEYETIISELRQAEADVGVERANLERAKVILGYTRITSPISGRIGKSAVTQGALVTANQDMALATVQQLDPIYVDVRQSSSEMLQLRRQLSSGEVTDSGSLPVTLILEDHSKYAYPGKLAFSEVSVDPTTGSFALRIIADNPDNLLLPGMYVRAELAMGIRAEAILAPQPGIMRDPKGNTSALVVGADDTVERRPVTVSQTVGSNWLVESGLAPGERLVIEGMQKIQPGMSVQVSEAGAENRTPDISLQNSLQTSLQTSMQTSP